MDWRPAIGYHRPAARVRFAMWLLLALVLAACGGEALPPRQADTSAPFAGPARTVFIVSNGWHSSIVMARSDLPTNRIREAADFPQARFLEFGWGDAEYYPAAQHTIAMTLRAALFPSPSVMHIAGLSVPPAQHYPRAEVIGLSLDAASLGQLIDYINGSFAHAGHKRATAIGPGLYPDSYFYHAVGSFTLINTCNTWTARALAAADLAVSERGTATAGALMRQVRGLARSP